MQTNIPLTPFTAEAGSDTHWFDKGPSGGLRITSQSAHQSLETFATAVRAVLGGPALEIRRWPYRYAGVTWWAFDIDGANAGASLTFVETGKTFLPVDDPMDGTGEVTDAADAHYLFEFLERRLSSSL